MKSRDQIISEYYEKYFQLLCNTGIQGLGSTIFHKLVERNWRNKYPKKILEVGAGIGEHLRFVKLRNGELHSYVCLDIRECTSINISKIENFEGTVEWVQASVNEIPFPIENFDRVTSTCLLHHLENPLEAFMEIRRVTKVSGEISIALPTDPGTLNGLVKKLITYPKARRIGIKNPEFIYALEHRNQAKGLLALIKEVFSEDELKIKYWPSRLRSINMNLALIVHVKKL